MNSTLIIIQLRGYTILSYPSGRLDVCWLYIGSAFWWWWNFGAVYVNIAGYYMSNPILVRTPHRSVTANTQYLNRGNSQSKSTILWTDRGRSYQLTSVLDSRSSWSSEAKFSTFISSIYAEIRGPGIHADQYVTGKSSLFPSSLVTVIWSNLADPPLWFSIFAVTTIYRYRGSLACMYIPAPANPVALRRPTSPRVDCRMCVYSMILSSWLLAHPLAWLVL